MHKFIVGIVLLLVGAVVQAGFTSGMRAYQEGDYATAARELRPLADQGLAHAQYLMGHMYQTGQGVAQDYAEAAKWYRLAAEQGIARAQYSLGVMFDGGYGVAKDQAEAAKWYLKAAEKGIGRAQNNLGVLYANGEGVTRDYVAAYMWLSLAAAQGIAAAAENRDAVAELMTRDQIANAETRARAWQARRPKKPSPSAP